MDKLEALLVSSPPPTRGECRPLLGDPWGETGRWGDATVAAGEVPVIGVKLSEDGVEGEPSPVNEWKEGVEAEWARPALPPDPGTNSAILLTDG